MEWAGIGFRERAQGGDVARRGIEPGVLGLFGQNDRHAVVDGGHKLVGRGSDNGAGLNTLALRPTPRLPDAGEGKEAAALEGEPQRYFRGVPPAPGLAPFVETVGGTRQRRRSKAAANIRDVSILSSRALIAGGPLGPVLDQ